MFSRPVVWLKIDSGERNNIIVRLNIALLAVEVNYMIFVVSFAEGTWDLSASAVSPALACCSLGL